MSAILTRYTIDVTDYGPLHVQHGGEFVELDLRELDYTGADPIKLSNEEADDIARALTQDFD